jgi:hypothetical protein
LKPYKTVLLPIQVCVGDFCFGGPENHVCPQFSNDGGYPVCEMKLSWDLKYDKENRVPKPEKCKALKEQ